MAQKVRGWVFDQIGQNLRRPQNTLFGRITTKIMLKHNSFLERNAVEKCNIQPDHKVLEIGFGPGVGLESAYKIVKKGKGVVYGIDTSMFMVDMVSKRLRKPMQDRKVLIFHGSASHIPLNTDSVHRVFHCNSYYFWPSMRSVLREIYRVMRPGGLMVTTLNLDFLTKNQHILKKYARPDPVKYMTCLENYGFEGVHLEYHIDASSGKTYQVIFAEVREKPAHDQSMLSDDEDDDLHRQEFLLRDKEEYEEFFNKKPNPEPKPT